MRFTGAALGTISAQDIQNAIARMDAAQRRAFDGVNASATTSSSEPESGCSESSVLDESQSSQGTRHVSQADGGYPDGNPKTQYGMAKPSTAAIPPVAVLHLGKAMRNGADKYGRFNWREHSVTASVYYDAMMRHLLAYWDGEEIAEDSGCHHLAHVMACCAILLDASASGKLNDDRIEGMAAEVIAAWTKTFTFGDIYDAIEKLEAEARGARK